MPKNIVVCCDGTGNQFQANPTNVLRLHRALIKDPEQQVVFYGPGVGTFRASLAWSRPGLALNKMMGLAMGVGYRQTIEDAYWFIVEHYQAGDRICLFGFSRGAYTVRVVAALLHGIGILPRGNRQLVQYALTELELRGGARLDFAHLGRFRKQFAQAIQEKPFLFLGAWDTVSSISWAYDYLSYAFTASNPGLNVVRHAVAIDERRSFFAQNLFRQRPEQDIREVWFAGSHADVGGGYPEDESELALTSLEWMLVEARDAGGVLFDDDQVSNLLKGREVVSGADPHNSSPLHHSLTWKWWLAEFFPKQRFPSKIPRPHLFRRRTMVAKTSVGKRPVAESSDNGLAGSCRIHGSAVRRKQESASGYSPVNWPREFQVEPEKGYFDPG